MNSRRSLDGDETWRLLLYWTKEQKASERLTASILENEKYSVDPSHPLGGKDGGKDLICLKDGLKLIGAAYFPRDQQSFTDIKKKFRNDLQGVSKNEASGIIFVTNQELKLGERKELIVLGGENIVELYHLERLVTILNSPSNYGIRYEYLDIEITKEELLAFHESRDRNYFERIEQVNRRLDELLQQFERTTEDTIGFLTGGDSYVKIYMTPEFFDEPGKILIMGELVGKYPVFDVGIGLSISRVSKEQSEIDFYTGRFKPDFVENIVDFHEKIFLPKTTIMLGYIDPPTVSPAFYTVNIIARNGSHQQLIIIQQSAKVNNLWQMKSYKIFSEGLRHQSNVRETYTNPDFSDGNEDI
jgi:hypothetical protein